MLIVSWSHTEIKETKSTDFDFNVLRRIGERRDGCYDHCFIFDNPKSKEMIVTNGELTLPVKTDLPSAQLSTPGSLNLGFKGKEKTERRKKRWPSA